MKKRCFFWGIAVIVAGIGVALIVPASRYYMLGLLWDEELVDGRPISYWVTVLKEDNDPEARRRAALMLGDAELNRQSEDEEEDCEPIIAALVVGLGDKDGFVRKCAATSFLLYPKEKPVPVDSASLKTLRSALSDKEIVVRQAAARALFQAGAAAKEADGVNCLARAMEDKNEFVRMFAARALAKIGPDASAAVPALVRSLRCDEDLDVRKLSAKALGLIGASAIGSSLPQAIDGLTKGLTGKNRGLREYSARALGQLEAKEAIPALRACSGDSDERVRAAAAEAVKRLEAPGGASPQEAKASSPSEPVAC
jgi:HEAT repeat protein